jgi:hypothetical protein
MPGAPEEEPLRGAGVLGRLVLEPLHGTTGLTGAPFPDDPIRSAAAAMTSLWSGGNGGYEIDPARLLLALPGLLRATES